MGGSYGAGICIYPKHPGRQDTEYNKSIYLEHLLPLEDYDKIIVLFSGGKDSLAAVLDLLDRGVPKEKIELWHHDIDGGHPTRHMDWPVTRPYVRAVAEHLGITLRVSWRINGFWGGEVYRVGASWPIRYTDGQEIRECKQSPKQIRSAELREKILDDRDRQELEGMGHRMKFPAKSGDLATRWCSSILKITVADSVIRNMDELNAIDGLAQDAKILVISGERRQESAGRSKYNEMETHRTNATAKAHRLVHQWRSVIDWDEAQVWGKIKAHHIAPHPCYAAGWNRCSCAMCIFGLPKHWAGLRELFPDWVAEVEEDERILGFTLDNKKTLSEYIGDAKSCVCHDNPKALHQLITGEFGLDDVYSEYWALPSGAFQGAEGGPC